MFGSPRTGSTWLLELLAHPLVLEARDPLGFRVPAGSDRPLDVVPINESLLPTHLSPRSPGDVRRRPWIRVPTDTFGDLAAYFFSEQFADVWRPAVRELCLTRFGAHMARAAAAHPMDERAVMVIKEPNGSHAAPLTMSVLARARLIFLYRDGRDVVDSLLAMNAPGGLIAAWTGRTVETPEERLALVRDESLNWVARMSATEQAFRERPPALRWRVRYEDLVADPGGTLEALARWLGLERDGPAIADAISSHAFGSAGQSATGSAATQRAASPGLWRRNLSEDESTLAREIMGDALHELGYEEDSVADGRSPG
jgi:Sulfotransferase family